MIGQKLINSGPSARGGHPAAMLTTALGTGYFSPARAVDVVLSFFKRNARPPRGTRRIPLTQGKWALVDARDFDRLSRWTWTAGRLHSGGWIATRREEGKPVIQMHRAICRTKKIVDHENGNGLDNRRRNLRPATYSQNGANSKRKGKQAHGFKGVYLDINRWKRKHVRPWVATIKVHYRTHFLGRHATAEAAARAYDRAARKFFGKFARTNFVRAERG